MPMTLNAPVDHELVIRKSRFIARVQPVQDRSETQALLKADKIPIVPQTFLSYLVPYDLEGWLSRHAQLAEVKVLSVSHDSLVKFEFELPQTQATDWQKSLNDAGQGKLVWTDESTSNHAAR